MKYLLLILFIVYVSAVTFSQEISGKWVYSTARVNGANLNPDQAKLEALNSAKAEAVRQAVGEIITEEIYRNVSETLTNGNSSEYVDIFSRLSNTISNGKIIEQDPPEYEYDFDEDGNPIYIVRLHAL